ncbi:Uncharacterised protein [Streptococcus pneumoniae]|nr:Uncharacterised protein [Streptococcus pneumoniae]
MTNLLFVSYSSNRVNVALPYICYMVTDFVSFITPQHCFEQSAASFLVCSLILFSIRYDLISFC